MKTAAEYGREWDAKWEKAGKLAERLKDPKYLRETLEKSYLFHDASHPEIPKSDPRVREILDFLQDEISKSDLNRRNFAMQLQSIKDVVRRDKISFYFNDGFVSQGSLSGIGFSVKDGFDQNGKLTSLGREALRHEGPLGHGGQVERASFITWSKDGNWHGNPLFNDVQGALISNVTEAKAMTVQCIANFEAGEPIGANTAGFSAALDDVLKKNNLTEQGLRDLRQTNPKRYNLLITEIKKQQFSYMCVNRAHIGGYETQTLVFMNIHGKGQANTPLFKKYFECECRSLGLTPKDAAELWNNFEPYATGKTAIPGFADCFYPDGNLCVADRNAVKSREGMRGLRKQLLWCYLLSDEDIVKIKEFDLKAGRELSILEEKLNATYKGKEWPQTDPNVNRYYELLEAKTLLVEELDSGYISMRQLNENPIIGKEVLKLNKKQFSAEEPTRKPAIKPEQAIVVDSPKSKVSKGTQPMRRVKQTLRKVNRWTQETPQGAATHAAGQFALNGAAMWAAHKLGKQWRSYEDVAKEEKMRVLFEQEVDSDVSVAKAQAYLGAGTMAVGAAGIGYAVAGRVVKKGTVLVGAKSIPFVGAILSAGCAIPRAMHGDWTGVGMELSSAAMDLGSAIAAVATPVTGGGSAPVAGYLAVSSMAMNIAIAARDGMQKNGIISLAMTDENGEIVLSQNKDENGNPLPVVGAQISYNHDKRNGPAIWRALDKNGYEYEAQIGSFKNDKKDGQWVTYSEDGVMLEMAHYKDDKLVGKYLRCDSNGKLVAMGDYTNGHFVEYWTDSNENATDILKWEGDFKNGEVVGVCRSYDRTGCPLSVIDYDHGVMEYVRTGEHGEVILDAKGSPQWAQMKFKPRTRQSVRPNARMQREMGVKTKDEKKGSTWNPRFGRKNKVNTKTPSQTQKQTEGSEPTQSKPVEPPKPAPLKRSDFAVTEQGQRSEAPAVGSLQTGASNNRPQKSGGMWGNLVAAGQRVRSAVLHGLSASGMPIQNGPGVGTKMPQQPTQTASMPAPAPVKPQGSGLDQALGNQGQGANKKTTEQYPQFKPDPNPLKVAKETNSPHKPGYVVDNSNGNDVRVLKVGPNGCKEVGRVDSKGNYKGESFDVAYSGQYDASWAHSGSSGVSLDGHGSVYSVKDGKLAEVGSFESNQKTPTGNRYRGMVESETRTADANQPNKTSSGKSGGMLGRLKKVSQDIMKGVTKDMPKPGKGSDMPSLKNVAGKLQAIGGAILNGPNIGSLKPSKETGSNTSVGKAMDTLARSNAVVGGFRLAGKAIRAGVKATQNLGKSASSAGKSGRSKGKEKG